jgi:hypothetical protein
MNPTRRDPIRLYAHALREGDLALAQLLHRRFIREALAVRVLGSLRARLR